ncbi:nucleoside monophosphate kinase [Candidatus Microgenomates bacterium]|nr:nucleoside monophosphate kinase [Candidatus Microgenomates bacterium]
MNIVLLGAPASGKGTQAELLAKKFNLYLLQTGALSRELSKSDERIEEIINSGKLIPQEEMTMHVINFLTKTKPDLKDILFEGFPRFISQYEALESFLKNKGDDIDAIISLDISLEEAVVRISSRRTCSKCGKTYNTITNPAPNGVCECGGELVQRKDDLPESVKVRFEYYEDNTKKLIEHVEKLGKLTRVDGTQSIEEIQKQLVDIVEKVKLK